MDAVTRRLALAVMPLALVALMLPRHVASAAWPAAAAQPGCVIPVPVLCPSPSPTPTPSASGKAVPMMEFTMNSLTLDSAPTLTVTQGGSRR